MGFGFSKKSETLPIPFTRLPQRDAYGTGRAGILTFAFYILPSFFVFYSTSHTTLPSENNPTNTNNIARPTRICMIVTAEIRALIHPAKVDLNKSPIMMLESTPI